MLNNNEISKSPLSIDERPLSMNLWYQHMSFGGTAMHELYNDYCVASHFDKRIFMIISLIFFQWFLFSFVLFIERQHR